MAVKGGAIFVLARLLKSPVPAALERALLMAQGGEFAFVLFTTAAASGLISADQQAIFSATVMITRLLARLSIQEVKLLTATAEAMLLYPTVDEPISASYTKDQRKISIRMINLNQSWQGIHADLLALVA